MWRPSELGRSWRVRSKLRSSRFSVAAGECGLCAAGALRQGFWSRSRQPSSSPPSPGEPSRSPPDLVRSQTPQDVPWGLFKQSRDFLSLGADLRRGGIERAEGAAGLAQRLEVLLLRTPDVLDELRLAWLQSRPNSVELESFHLAAEVGQELLAAR